MLAVLDLPKKLELTPFGIRYICMGFYSRYILPTIIDRAMGNREARRLRAESIAKAYGDVLEIGIGSGRNLEFYTPEVNRIYGIDPSIELQKKACKRMGSATVKFLAQSAEQPLPFCDGTIDTGVITW